KVQPGDLIHADKHGFLSVPADEQEGLLEAARFMDANECNTVMPVVRGSTGRSPLDIVEELEASIAMFSANVREKFRREGEW
ncbi:MAG TPA: RraA family protein, partial [Prosthecobacter sp.]|nr:RraA family protein [Prosthecobacter sp.]